MTTTAIAPAKSSAARKAEAVKAAIPVTVARTEDAKSVEVCAFDPKTHAKEAALEQQAKTSHLAVLEASKTAVEAAHEAGEALKTLKARVKEVHGHGHFEAYCRTVLKMSERTAQVYMRVADNWQTIERAGVESLAGAIASLRKPEDAQQRLANKPGPAEKLATFASEAHEAFASILKHVADLSKAPAKRKQIAEQIAATRDVLDKLDDALAAAPK